MYDTNSDKHNYVVKLCMTNIAVNTVMPCIKQVVIYIAMLCVIQIIYSYTMYNVHSNKHNYVILYNTDRFAQGWDMYKVNIHS